MDNHEIRQRIKNSGMKQWQVAAELGTSEATLIRWLRKDELPENVQQQILAILTKSERR